MKKILFSFPLFFSYILFFPLHFPFFFSPLPSKVTTVFITPEPKTALFMYVRQPNTFSLNAASHYLRKRSIRLCFYQREMEQTEEERETDKQTNKQTYKEQGNIS